MITLPSLPGEEPKRFVADFTIEQYGGEEWWVEFADYLQGMTSDGKSFQIIENQSEGSLGCSQSFRWEAARLGDLCAALDWSVLGMVGDESKRGVLYSLVTESMSARRRAGGLSSRESTARTMVRGV